MIYVSSLAVLETAIARHAPSHLMTLLDPATLIDTPAGVDPARHLKVGVNDIAEPEDGYVHPAEDHVRAVIDFASGWAPDAPMLIHCWAGVSRSTAAAFITACVHAPDAEETAIARAIRDAAGYANPNRRLVALADRLMGRDGRMIAAVEAIGPGNFDTYPEEPIFALPLSGTGPKRP